MRLSNNDKQIIRTDALVTRHHKLGESDMIVTLLTPNHGLLRAVASGMRRPKSRIGASLDLLQHSQMFVRFGRNLHSVSQASTVNDFSFYAKDALLFVYGCYVAELAEHFASEGEPNQRLFDLLIVILKAMPHVTQRTLLCRWFDIRLLQLSGFTPQMRVCVECNNSLEPQTHRFSVVHGGIICGRCITQLDSATQVLMLNWDLVQLVDFMVVSHWRKLDSLTISQTNLEGLNRLLRSYIKHILGKLPRSAAVLAEFKN